VVASARADLSDNEALIALLELRSQMRTVRQRSERTARLLEQLE